MIVPDQTFLAAVWLNLVAKMTFQRLCPVWLRVRLLRSAGVVIGKHVVIRRHVRFATSHVILEDGVVVASNSVFEGLALIRVTRGTSVPPRTVIASGGRPDCDPLNGRVVVHRPVTMGPG